MKIKRIVAVGTSVALMCTMTACSASEKSTGAAAVPTVAKVELLSVDAKAAVAEMKIAGQENPIGIDNKTPCFSWQMSSDVIGAAQSAYQIVVKDKEDKTVWDSGKVDSQNSADIAYEGEGLQPQSQYTWQVTVTDTGDNSVESEIATFETGLMNDSMEAWSDAQWIGADTLSVDAASTCVFKIVTKLQIPEGSNSASIILGANDFRLENSNFNINSMAGENYVRLELDLSGVNESGGAKINAYRMGYAESDSNETPIAVIEGNEDLDGIINAANAHGEHEVIVDVCASKIAFSIDGTTIKETLTVNDLGGDSSYNTYPNLNSIGFAAKAGESAVFTDYRVENGGNYGTGTLFGENEGSTYQIFNEMNGVAVEGNVITVNGGDTGVLGYADPTYGAAPMLRKSFDAAKEVESARLYLTAQGIYNFYMNGTEVAAEEWFNPGATEYDQILGYNTYDVTDMISQGENAMGAVLGEGWWTGQMTYEAANSNYFGDQPALMGMLQITYADGSQETISTDDTWKYYGDGPVRLASFFQGERYDATKEVDGWNRAEFDDSAWAAATTVETRKPFANPKIVARTDTPVHVIRTNEVVKSLGATKEGSDSYIYDMGENVSGVPVITIPAEYAKAGETITVRFAEILYPESEEYVQKGIDGTLMVENYRAAMVTDFYTMKDGENVFAPDLTFHGYRYIEITGLEQELPAECVQMQVLSSLDTTATYTSSNELANQLFTNITNSTTSNYISIPTDCPQRNERMGWAGDAQIFALTGSYVADTYNFMEQWMDSVRADTAEDGMSTQYSPAFEKYELTDEAIVHEGQSFGITWNALAVTVPYNLYMQTGRLDIVEENIENINAYMNTLISKPLSYKDAAGEKKEDARLTGETGTLADHLARVTTDPVLLGNAVYIACLDEAAVMSNAVGDTEKAQEYTKKAEEAREAYNELFIDAETGKTVMLDGTVVDTQASYATPLRFNVITEKNLEKVVENYNATIAEASGEDSDGVAITPYTLTTGFNATGNLLNALSDNGLNDTAYKLFESTDYASWLYPVTQGATSIWERWNSYTEENDFNGNNSMNSFNHYSYGAVGEWMLGYQAGIMANDGNAGYQSFILQPTVGGTFTDLAVEYDSNYGKIVSKWSATEGNLASYEVTVPANTTATLYLPTEAKDASKANGVKYVEAAEHHGMPVQVYQLVAGTYQFEIADGEVTVQ